MPQPASGVTYASKIEKADTRLDWTRSAAALERAVRAFRPAPGAFALLEGEPVKIWRARIVERPGAPGEVLDSSEEILVGCGEQSLAIGELQRAGARRLSAAEFLHGHRVPAGTRFL